MTPFLQFRVWLRLGPTRERITAGAAAVLAVVLLGWALVPVAKDDTEVATASGFGASDSAATGAGGGAPTTAVGAAGGAAVGGPDAAVAGGSSGGDPAAAAPGAAGEGGGGAPTAPSAADCSNLTATDQGVTPEEILVAVPLISLGGSVGNETFGIRGDLPAVAQAAAAGLNSSGGAACRRVRIQTYEVNALDQNDARAKCLEIIADEPFAVIDFGAYLGPTLRRCFVDARLPMLVALAITDAEAASAFPYLYTLSASSDQQLRSWAHDAAARGVFGGDFRKLGIVIDGCEPASVDRFMADLDAVGVTADRRSVFTVSCDSNGSADQLFQAMTQHQRDGATDVFLGIAQLAATQYVQLADGIGYRPRYSGSDYGAITNTTSEGNWSSGFDGAISITSTRSGELNSDIEHPLLAPCQQWYTDAGVRPPTEDGDSALAMCSLFSLFQAAANANGPNLVRDRFLIDGLARVGRFESVAYTDVVFDRPGKVTGGDTIRSIAWRSSCRCFLVETVDLRPAP